MIDPICEKCGAPVDTGLMALFCPGREACAFWPEEGIDLDFIQAYPSTWSPDEQQRFREHCDARAAQGKESGNG